MAQRELQIELALQAIRTGEASSIRAAHCAYKMPESRSARVSMEQQTHASHTNIARGFLLDKRGSLLTVSSNKRQKASLPRTLVLVKWLPELYA
jgi:hypothetical protein